MRPAQIDDAVLRAAYRDAEARGLPKGAAAFVSLAFCWLHPGGTR